jgi:hypothetical protein
MLLVARLLVKTPKTFHAQIGTTSFIYILLPISNGPRNFAENVGIKFSTPEEFFLGEAPRPFTRTFEPSAYIEDLGKSKCSTLSNLKPRLTTI